MTAASSQQLTAAVITVSDSCSRGERKDLSGPAVAQALVEAGYQIVLRETVPDCIGDIVVALRRAVQHSIRLLVTTGGTGISASDVTPEATEQVCERLLPGVAELMRAAGQLQTPTAVLSRGLCGAVETSLIVNLPGSPRGAVDSLKIALPVIPHALDLLAGKTQH